MAWSNEDGKTEKGVLYYYIDIYVCYILSMSNVVLLLLLCYYNKPKGGGTRPVCWGATVLELYWTLNPWHSHCGHQLIAHLQKILKIISTFNLINGLIMYLFHVMVVVFLTL